MLVVTDQQLVLPPERLGVVLGSLSLKEIFIIAHTPPWDDSAELAVEAQHRGWNTEVHREEVGVRRVRGSG